MIKREWRVTGMGKDERREMRKERKRQLRILNRPNAMHKMVIEKERAQKRKSSFQIRVYVDHYIKKRSAKRRNRG